MTKMEESIQKNFSVTGQKARAVDLVFKNLSVTVKKTKILHDVSGIAKAGTMLAVMGPSGAGKSTLLNTISGRLPVTSGSLLLNDQPIDKAMKRRICYVLQNDLFFTDITLMDTLTYAAMLRLPDKMAYKDKIKRVNEIIDVLDLRKCVKTAMGGMGKPGLSGGEKKRASIAVELLTNPSLMLLDEPTTGLDAATAKSLIRTLGRYASESGKTVIATIHQPSSSVFYMFDNILLVSNGKLVYFGPGTQIMDFYAGVGLNCALHYNPADFILEQLKAGAEVEESLINACTEKGLGLTWPEQASVKRDVTQEGANVQGFDNPGFTDISLDSNGTQDQRQSNAASIGTGDLVEEAMDSYYKDGDKWPTSWSTQFYWLTRRALKVGRARILSLMNIGRNIAIAVMVGLLFFQIDRTEATAFDRMGVLYFSAIFYCFNPVIDAIMSFPFEKGLIDRERIAGTYRLSAYYLAKSVSELPLVFTMPTVYICIVYWMSGLLQSAWHFISVWAILLFSTCAAQGVGYFLSVSFPKVPPALVAAVLFMLFSLLTGGFLTQNLPFWIEWAQYLSFISYTLNAVLQIEFGHGPPLICSPMNTTSFPLICNPVNSVDNDTTVMYLPGEAFLERNTLNLPIHWALVAIGAYTLVFRILAYVALRTFRSPT